MTGSAFSGFFFVCLFFLETLNNMCISKFSKFYYHTSFQKFSIWKNRNFFKPSIGALMKRGSNMQQSYRRTPMPKCDLNKVVKQLYWYALQHECSPVNFCIFSEHLTLGTHMEDCFWIVQSKKDILVKFQNLVAF